jgi:type II secretory pathway predicted ATPase ExeA
MYEAFFGLKENPFTLSPDPQYLYLSPQHREALNCLIYGIHEKKGFMVITGGIGTGKTTLCRSLLAGLDDTVATALIFNPALSDIELLKTINQEFGVRMGRGRGTKKRYLDALNAFLMQNFAAGRNAVLLIDEAQNLPHGVMEQIRMLSNLETVREKLIQIILLGQPELLRLLALPSLRQLNERITVRYDLKPIARENVRHYVELWADLPGVAGHPEADQRNLRPCAAGCLRKGSPDRGPAHRTDGHTGHRSGIPDGCRSWRDEPDRGPNHAGRASGHGAALGRIPICHGRVALAGVLTACWN